MPMFSLIEYSDNYSKPLGTLCQYYRYEPNAALEDSESFESRVKISGKPPDDCKYKEC